MGINGGGNHAKLEVQVIQTHGVELRAWLFKMHVSNTNEKNLGNKMLVVSERSAQQMHREEGVMAERLCTPSSPHPSFHEVLRCSAPCHTEHNFPYLSHSQVHL